MKALKTKQYVKEIAQLLGLFDAVQPVRGLLEEPRAPCYNRLLKGLTGFVQPVRSL